jgi:hypothetical protein
MHHLSHKPLMMEAGTVTETLDTSSCLHMAYHLIRLHCLQSPRRLHIIEIEVSVEAFGIIKGLVLVEW